MDKYTYFIPNYYNTYFFPKKNKKINKKSTSLQDMTNHHLGMAYPYAKDFLYQSQLHFVMSLPLDY